MSERKTAEIKFRIEPSVKAFWQAQAADETEGNLSELIVKATNQYAYWARENARLAAGGVSASYEGLCDCGRGDVCTGCSRSEAKVLSAGIPLVPNPNLPEGEPWVVDSDGVVDRRSQPLAIIKNITDYSPTNPALLPNEDKGGLREFISTNVSEAGSPLTREALDNAWFGPLKSEKSVPKSWMYEGQNG